jgi:hypothetical protein
MFGSAFGIFDLKIARVIKITLQEWWLGSHNSAIEMILDEGSLKCFYEFIPT